MEIIFILLYVFWVTFVYFARTEADLDIVKHSGPVTMLTILYYIFMLPLIIIYFLYTLLKVPIFNKDDKDA